MTLIVFLLVLCGLALFLRAAVFVPQSVCPPVLRRAVLRRAVLRPEPGREGERLNPRGA